jgi:pimeloyl-ACP methyl ester carboxylesterase
MNENPSGRSVEVNGTTLHYDEHGDGAPLILIHGGLATSSQWEPVVPELVADSFRVITPDSRAHGRSTNPHGELSYAQIAADCPDENSSTSAMLSGRYPDVSTSQVASEPFANALCHRDRLRPFEEDLGVANGGDELVGGAQQLG